MSFRTSKCGRASAAALLAAFVLLAAAGCGAGGLGVEVAPTGQQPPPPPLQGVSVQCDPTSLVFLESVDIDRAGTTISYPANLAPGQQMFLDLPAGPYDLYGIWNSGGFLMKDSVPFKFTVHPHQVAFVSWK